MSEESKHPGTELNEAALEGVAGGANSGEGFNSAVWYNRNCMRCSKKSACSTLQKLSAATKAEEAAKRGEEWNCPKRC